MTRQHGFSLLEIMIVVTIVAILAATATMGYGRYVQRANRSEAKSVLVDLAQRLERYYTDQGTYDGFSAPTALRRVPAETSRTQLYAVSVATNDQTFTVTAAPRNQQLEDRCGSLNVDNVGRRGSTGGGDCW